MPDIKATDSLTYNYQGGTLVHEIYDGDDMFRHRLTADIFNKKFEGEWCEYQSFARITVKCHKCEADHVFMATQDTWQPMFPPIFELRIPNAEDTPTLLHPIFAAFLEHGKN